MHSEVLGVNQLRYGVYASAVGTVCTGWLTGLLCGEAHSWLLCAPGREGACLQLPSPLLQWLLYTAGDPLGAANRWRSHVNAQMLQWWQWLAV